MSLSRRDLISGCAGAAVLLGVGGLSRYAFADAPLLRPPGGQDETHLLAACIKCDRCRSVCPTRVVGVTSMEDGPANARTPKLSFRANGHTEVYASPTVREGYAPTNPTDGLSTLANASGSAYCNFCMLCVDSCPTGALRTFDATVEWIGQAVVAQAYCIAFEKVGGCRKCVDYCPMGAITLDETQRPVVDLAKCNGCGVCENICPTDSYRSFSGSSKRGINVEVATGARPQ